MGKSKSSIVPSIFRVTIIFTLAALFLTIVLLIILRITIRGREVVVPDITGKSFVEATQILSKHHLGTPKIEGEKYSANMPEGYVVEQKPSAGQKVKSGRQVKVFLSKGTEAGIVPDVLGQTVDDAQTVLLSMGLEVGTITKVHTDDYPIEGNIIAHTPPPKAKIQKGAKVNLLVSLGRPLIQMTMPDIGGMTLDDAKELLKSRGLVLGQVMRQASVDIAEPNIILEQSPQPNDRIKRGTVVNLVVSSL